MKQDKQDDFHVLCIPYILFIPSKMIMQNFSLAATELTPAVRFNCKENHLVLKGNSYPEDPSGFYAPVFDWLQQYLAQLNPDMEVQVNVEIAYFNSGSSKMLVDFFDMLNEKAFNDAIPIDINWYYDPEDPDMLEYGKDFQADFRAMKFQFIEQEYNNPMNT